MLLLTIDISNRLLTSVRLAALAYVAIIAAGCSPSPIGKTDEQSLNSKTRLTLPQPKLPVVPTLASHDASSARVIDGSAARRIQWPSASQPSGPNAVIDVIPDQQLRWPAEYPLARINDLAWSPDGKLLAVGGMIHESENEMFRSPTRIYSEDGTVAAELFSSSMQFYGSNGSISDLEWSRDSGILATAEGLNMSASLFFTASQKRIELNDVAISVHAVRWSPDGKFFVLITGDKDLYLYDAEGKRIDVVGPAGSTVDSVCWHPDGTMLACADPFGVMLWGLVTNLSEEASQKPISLVPLIRISLPLVQEQWVNTLEWNHDGSRLAVGAFGTGDVWLVDREGTPLATMRGHTESVWRVLFSSDGNLATTSSDATTRLWDQDGNPIAVLVSAIPEEDILISVAAWSPNGELLAVVSLDQFIRIYTSDAVPLANLSGHTGNIQAVSWHPNKQSLASADDKRLTCLWSIPTQSQ